MSDKFGEGRDPYLYPGLDIMRNRLNIRQQQRLEQAAYEMTALRAATIELGPLVRGLPHLRTIHRQLYQDIFDWAGQLREVDILSPSRFKNSLAGTFSGKINDPSAFNIAGNTIQ